MPAQATSSGRFQGHGGSVREKAVTFSPNGKLVASGSDDQTVKVWDTGTGGVKHTLQGHGDYVNVALLA